jgi:hypothetical protein
VFSHLDLPDSIKQAIVLNTKCFEMFIRNKPRKRIKTKKEGEKQGKKTNENEGKKGDGKNNEKTKEGQIDELYHIQKK